MVEPRVARKHWLFAWASRSICMGFCLRLGVRSIQPGSLGPALELEWISTSVIVTKIWLNDPPCEAEQVVGSLTVRLTMPILALVVEFELPQPDSRKKALQAAMTVAVMQRNVFRDM